MGDAGLLTSADYDRIPRRVTFHSVGRQSPKSGCLIRPLQRHFAEETVSIACDEPIGKVGKRLDKWERKELGQWMPPLQSRQQRKKRIESCGNRSIRMDEKRGRWPARPVVSSQHLLGFFALIRDQTNFVGVALPTELLEAVFGRHAQPALAVIDKHALP